MRIVFMGTPEFAVPSLDALVEAGHDVVAAYSPAAAPGGPRQGAADRGAASAPKRSGSRCARRQPCAISKRSRRGFARSMPISRWSRPMG